MSRRACCNSFQHPSLLVLATCFVTSCKGDTPLLAEHCAFNASLILVTIILNSIQDDNNAIIIMLTMLRTTALLWVLISIALHVTAEAAINNDGATAIPACSNGLDPGAFSKNVASDPASRLSSKTSVTTCKHRAAQGEALLIRVKFLMPWQPSSRNLELRWVREVACAMSPSNALLHHAV